MLSEKIYKLRHKNGLSQEQLAEKIGVSRQTISKWESNLSTPELEKLLALCECFHITLDELTSEQAAPISLESDKSTGNTHLSHPSISRALGIGFCLLGIFLMILVGLSILASPPIAQQVNASSTITINGSGLLFLLCTLLIMIGMFLIFRRK